MLHILIKESNLDNPPEEVIAGSKEINSRCFARFKIIDPLKFYISVGNERVLDKD